MTPLMLLIGGPWVTLLMLLGGEPWLSPLLPGPREQEGAGVSSSLSPGWNPSPAAGPEVLPGPCPTASPVGRDVGLVPAGAVGGCCHPVATMGRTRRQGLVPSRRSASPPGAPVVPGAAALELAVSR